jgi:hypothetical protein
MKSGGIGLRVGKSCRGSPFMSQMMWNLLGSSVSMGLILRATGLYHFPANTASRVQSTEAEYVHSVLLQCEAGARGIVVQF